MMETVTITDRSTDEEIKDALDKLERELQIRDKVFLDIEADTLTTVLERFRADYCKNTSADIPSWLKMNFRLKP